MSTGYTVKVFVATVFVFLNVILTFQVLTFFVPYSNSCNACLLFYVLPILYPLYVFFVLFCFFAWFLCCCLVVAVVVFLQQFWLFYFISRLSLFLRQQFACYSHVEDFILMPKFYCCFNRHTEGLHYTRRMLVHTQNVGLKCFYCCNNFFNDWCECVHECI